MERKGEGKSGRAELLEKVAEISSSRETRCLATDWDKTGEMRRNMPITRLDLQRPLVCSATRRLQYTMSAVASSSSGRVPQGEVVMDVSALLLSSGTVQR